MCFSPYADFAAGGALVGVGVLTLSRVHERRELIVGALPLLFGLHQIVEAFVWLGLEGHVSAGLGNVAKETYILFAHVALPIIVPLGFMLIEPERRRVRWMRPLVALGLLMGAYLLWQVTAFPVGAVEDAHCIDYTTHTPNDIFIGGLYVLATCGPSLMSSRAYLRVFGLISLIGAIAVAIIRVDDLTSLWCVYVAVVSVLILEHFRRQSSARLRAPPVPVRA